MTSEDPLAQLESGPVFVVGWVRSGTTWLYDVLTAHPDVGGVLESWMFTHDYGVRGPLTDFHWEPDDAGSTQGLARIAEREEVFAGIRGLTSSWLAKGLGPDHRYLVEKSPSHIFAMDRIAELYPEARFVHVIRDGRDVVVSARAAARTWAPSWSRGFASSPRSSARAWNRAVLAGMKLGADLGDRYLELRYEDLRARPAENIARMFEHCRIPLDRTQLTEIVERTAFRPSHGGEGAHRRRGRPGEWRTALRPWEAAMVTHVAREGLDAAGYPRGRGGSSDR